MLKRPLTLRHRAKFVGIVEHAGQRCFSIDHADPR
jgi:hypothetical protein